eukprot:scaffold8721_cov80-Phaeocystis_antarctica.AAC.23
MRELSGSQGTSTVRLARDFCRLFVRKSSSPAVSPPSRDIRNESTPSLHTAECMQRPSTQVGRPDAFSLAKLMGFASMRIPRQPKHRSSMNVFENFFPSRAPSSTNTPGLRSPPTARMSVGRRSTSSSCCDNEAPSAHAENDSGAVPTLDHWSPLLKPTPAPQTDTMSINTHGEERNRFSVTLEKAPLLIGLISSSSLRSSATPWESRHSAARLLAVDLAARLRSNHTTDAGFSDARARSASNGREHHKRGGPVYASCPTNRRMPPALIAWLSSHPPFYPCAHE